MAVGRRTLARILAPVRRGQHAGAERDWLGVGERTRIVVIAGVVAVVALIATAAILPSSGKEPSSLLPPLPGRMSPLPLVPVPWPQPSGPPGFPSAIPTAETPSPTPAATSPSPPRTARPPLAPVSYEAEAASNVLTGGARIRDVRAASGGEVIGHIGGSRSSSLRFTRIVVPADGVYTVAIHYISADNRSAALSVNDGRFMVLRFPGTNDWDTVGSLTLRIRFDSGINSLEFSNPVAYAPDIDRIVVGS